MAKYIITKESRDKIKDFLTPLTETIKILEKEELDDEETNKLLATLGRYPAFETYELIDMIRNTVTVKESGDGK